MRDRGVANAQVSGAKDEVLHKKTLGEARVALEIRTRSASFQSYDDEIYPVVYLLCTTYTDTQ
jgi:hypothetical protein